MYKLIFWCKITQRFPVHVPTDRKRVILSSSDRPKETIVAIEVKPNMVVRLNDLRMGFQIVGGELTTLYCALFDSSHTDPSSADSLYVDISVRHVVISSGVRHHDEELVALFHADKLLDFAIFLFPNEIVELIRIDKPNSGHNVKRNRALSPGQRFSTRRN